MEEVRVFESYIVVLTEHVQQLRDHLLNLTSPNPTAVEGSLKFLGLQCQKESCRSIVVAESGLPRAMLLLNSYPSSIHKESHSILKQLLRLIVVLAQNTSASTRFAAK